VVKGCIGSVEGRDRRWCAQVTGRVLRQAVVGARRHMLGHFDVKQTAYVELGAWRTVCCLLAMAGCNSGAQSVGPPKTDMYPLRALAVFYAEFSGEHGGRPPSDEAEFREFLATRQERLTAGGLDVERVLKSPRSGERWVVVYGPSGPLVIDGMGIVAYEKSAVDGKRMAVNIRGGLEMIDENKLSAAVPQ
jgi:hypothetical protein